MSCPICDQKPMNCDCMPRERSMWLELQELEDRPAVVLTDAEREAIQAAAVIMDARNRLGGPVMFRGSERAATLRGLLERTGDCPASDNAADRNNGTTGSE